MKDDAFNLFLQRFGPATPCQDVSDALIASYTGKLPERLLEYWREYGWCGYSDGLFWIVNPAQYKDLLDAWLENTEFRGTDDYFVIARTAFGRMFVWGTKTGSSLLVDPPFNTIYPNPKSAASVAKDGGTNAIRAFIGTKKPENVDMDDEAGSPLFARARKKLGPLGEGEVYGFVPALAMGGRAALARLAKLPLVEHLTFLAQLDRPQIVRNPLLG